MNVITIATFRDDLHVTPPLDQIVHGDIVQLVHGTSLRNLNTHNVAAPLSATKQVIFFLAFI